MVSKGIKMLMDHNLLINTYNAFNTRNIETALAAMHPAVEWPNGMEGGYVHGHSEGRDAWTRQGGLIDPYVEPQHCKTDETGQIMVDVHQVVRDRAGNILSDQ